MEEINKITPASHRQLVGNSYWGDVMVAEIGANGHGDQNSTNAGLIAVVESWAEFVALDYAHQIYLGNNSVYQASYAQRLELIRNEEQNHIPIGLHNDLVDNTPLEASAFDEDDLVQQNFPFAINDQVQGFTKQQMFQSLNANVTTPDEYRIWINSNFTGTSGNNVSDVNSLFNSY